MKEHGIIEIIGGIIIIIQSIISLIIGKPLIFAFGVLPFVVGEIVMICIGAFNIWLGRCFLRDYDTLMVTESKANKKVVIHRTTTIKKPSYSKQQTSFNSYVKCPQCGKENLSSNDYCSTCFAPLRENKK